MREGSKNTYVLDHTAHTCLGDAAASEYLHGVASGVLCGAGRRHLQQTYRTSEHSRLLLIGLQAMCQ